MFGLFGKKKNVYPDLTSEYYSILKRDFGMNEPYISAFIGNSGDALSKAENNIRNNYNSPNLMSSSIKAIINDFGFEHSVIVFVCNTIYMKDFKNGKILSRNYEYAVVGLLVKLKHITGKIDPLFVKWLDSNCDLKWPNLKNLVFAEGES